MSVPLSLEYEDVLGRRQHLEVSGMTGEQVQLFVDTILRYATRVLLHSSIDLPLTDPGDMHVYRLAVSGEADAVVTHNIRHFASLQRCPIHIHQQTMDIAQALAAEREISVEQVVDDAVQYGVSAMRQQMYFAERVKRAQETSLEQTLEILARAGRGNPPDPWDEIPEDLKEWAAEQRVR